ncbi:MAG TPA: alpha/beta hydrolase [Polyangiales bacterium]|nr:alpha/beta hydrolase [Polyangiales bacterium]
MDAATFHAQRRHVETASGRIAYFERGSGRAALFIHGVPFNGFHWRFVIDQLHMLRRCIAPDLMGLGYTQIASTQDVSFRAQAEMLRHFIDVLDLEQVDVIANDSGGAVAQLFAAYNPQRVRTLTLTNCDVHDNWPPPAIAPQIALAREGTLLDSFARYLDDPAGRLTRFSRAFADPSVLTDEVYRVYIEPLCATEQTRANFHRYWLAFDNAQTVAIEPLLRQLQAPALIVCALDDIFFELKWAHWLQRTLPRVVRTVTVADAKLFFAEDRPQALIDPLREFLATR